MQLNVLICEARNPRSPYSPDGRKTVASLVVADALLTRAPLPLQRSAAAFFAAKGITPDRVATALRRVRFWPAARHRMQFSQRDDARDVYEAARELAGRVFGDSVEAIPVLDVLDAAQGVLALLEGCPAHTQLVAGWCAALDACCASCAKPKASGMAGPNCRSCS